MRIILFCLKSLFLLLTDTVPQDSIFHLVTFFVFGSAKHGMSHPLVYENNLVIESNVAIDLLQLVVPANQTYIMFNIRHSGIIIIIIITTSIY